MKTLIEYINENVITEMASSRNRFINIISDRMSQILQNWCLVYYCNIYDKENINKNHWITELKSYILYINKTKTKWIDRHKAIIDSVIKYDELNTESQVNKCVYHKLKKENIKDDIIYKIIKECAINIYNIIELIETDNIYEIDEEINNIGLY